MTAIGPGTLLICVDANEGYNPHANDKNPKIRQGSLYKCTKMWPFRVCWRDDCGILIDVDHRNVCLCVNRFKPFIDGLDVEIKEEEKEPEHV